MEIEILYEDENLLVIDKPAGIVVFLEDKKQEKTLINLLSKKYPDLNKVGSSPRYGIVHRLDKDTSGVLLVAKNEKTLYFLQEQFKERRVEKKYILLAVGNLKQNQGKIETLMGRATKDRRKQKAYLPQEPASKGKSLRSAETEYKVIEKFKDFTLIEALPKTGRKHQLRAHLAYLNHPIAGDKLYGFKNQPCPEGLKRQFLHASYIRLALPKGKKKEFVSKLPNGLQEILNNLKK
jgi:23S rRNA pseudouridine1911/1915/1917 synthase